MQGTTARQYRIRGILGKGGFGTVYRATLEGPDGFRKEVALKVLNAETMPDTFLARFRDEARMLGLVRDRAVVGVDPPTVLNGQVTLVMEFVDGESGARLVRRHRYLPLRVCCEIVQEIARALDSVYNQRGPNGQRLELLHRDIKPANIQLTPGGSVKILDFGIAKAVFDERESATTQHIMGTLKYMAPERIDGVEGPFGDVYSLGCVFRRFLLGDKPRGMGKWRESGLVARTEQISRAIAFIERMTSLEHDERPTIGEVEEFCSELSAGAEGPSFRKWAGTNVECAPIQQDEGSGSLLVEQPSRADPTIELEPRPVQAEPVAPTAWGTGWRVALGLGVGFTGVFGMVVALGTGWLYWPDDATPAVEESLLSAAPKQAETAVVAPVPHPVAPATVAPAQVTEETIAMEAPRPEPSQAARAAPVSPNATPVPSPAVAPSGTDHDEVAEPPTGVTEVAPSAPTVSLQLDGLTVAFVDGSGARISASALSHDAYTVWVAFDAAAPGELVDVGLLDLRAGDGSVRCSSAARRCTIRSLGDAQ